MPAVLLALALAAAPQAPQGSPAAPRGADPLARRRAALAERMVALGAALKREIEAGDADALLARVPAEGLRCAGQVIPRARVARDLRRPGSWLHEVLLERPGPASAGPPRSLRAFFAAAPEVAILVAFRRDAQAGPVGLPCVEYRARDFPTPGAPFCFEERGGRWWLAESLYPCG